MMTYYDDIRKVQDLHLPWEILTDINILIVGASGLIGRALVDTLMQLPDKTFHLYAGVRDLVYAQSCFMRYKDDESFTLIQCDLILIFTILFMQRAMRGRPPFIMIRSGL